MAALSVTVSRFVRSTRRAPWSAIRVNGHVLESERMALRRSATHVSHPFM